MDHAFNCRLEEIPVLCRYVLNYFERDQAEFIAYSPLYNATYKSDFELRLAAVDDLVTPYTVTGEMKKITVRIDGHYANLRTELNKLEKYAKLAGNGLTVHPDDLGFKLIRDQVQSRNDEGVIRLLKELLRNLKVNAEVLAPVGLTPAMLTDLEAFIKTFTADSMAQTTKLKDRTELTRENVKEINALYAIVTDVLETGKVIFKAKDKAKVRDYTFTDLLKLVRKTQKAKEEGQSQAKAQGEKV